MKFKATGSVALILTMAVLGQTLFGRATVADTNDFSAKIARFETVLEAVRQELKIPAYSAAIVKDQRVIWAKGFGYADIENKIPATEHTPYHLASLTKTFASTILMQLVQEGKVKLDDPVSKYGITLESDGVIRVRHLLSHTSEGNPGEQYRYNGNRFGELDKVIQKASGKSFGELLIANILEPLGMNETAPNVFRVVSTKSPDAAGQAAEAEVKAAVMDIIGGYNSSNVDQIEKRMAPQQNRFQGEGGFLTSFNGADLRSAFQSGIKLKVDVYNLEAAVYGDSAITTFFMQGNVTSPNGPARTEGPWRVSYFWNKQDGLWKLVHAHQSPLGGAVITEKHQQRFDTVVKTLAQPYALDREFKITKISYPQGFSTAAGLISTVLDMAKYDIAIDQNKFLTKETQQLAFTPAVSTKTGEPLPYGLGWFTQNYKGTKMLWHYGYWTGNSSFILKVPDQHITFIIMANSDNLSRPTDLGTGDALSSKVSMAFLRTFIFPEKFGEAVPEINWDAPVADLKNQLNAVQGKPYADIYRKELVTKFRIDVSTGLQSEAARIMKMYGELFAKPLPDDLVKLPLIAQIIQVVNSEDKTVPFSLPSSQDVRVFAIGEGQGGAMSDYGWIENEQGSRVWEMQEPKTSPAGGANKNRKVDTQITLPAGNYKLRYKSDDSHSFDRWNALPPDINFWGIAIYKK
ncbi:MAG TPA: serine hydrolase [Pyrinomonadaceae bacterium]|nr:serine hydrolase [Pyrinomonadaceae bacterium]